LFQESGGKPVKRVRQMKMLVVGAGSIGERHLKNLLKLGHRDVEVCEPSAAVRRKLAKWFRGSMHGDLSSALRSKPDAALIATPTHRHVASATACARAGCHLFIEKPLSHSLAGLDRLERLIRSKKLICLVACNMRFHPGLALLKKCVDERRIGKVWGAGFEFGYYLPYWRPGRDFRKTYSAYAAQGGGVILDCIHELDAARWILGEAVRGSASASRKPILGIDAEEDVDLRLESASGVRIGIHLDYLQKVYRRRCSIYGSGGVLEWDWNEPGVRWHRRGCVQLDGRRKFSTNDMYVAEMTHFLRCLSKKERPAQTFEQGVSVLRLALALKKNLKNGKPVRVGRRS
jgi:predicted dehydrogenase